MNKIFLSVLLLTSYCAQATFVPVSLSGFNHDVVANGVGNATASTTIAVDNANYDLVAPDFKAVAGNSAPSAALPANGLINSAQTSGLTYQLASYTGNNALVLSAANAPATLTFNTVCGGDVYVIGFTGSGTSTADITVNFTNNTSQTFAGISFADWFGGTGFALQGFGRIQRLTNGLEAPSGDPRLYEKKLTLSSANSTKTIASITVTKTTSTGVLNIMAVSVCQTPLISTQPVDANICKGWNTFFGVNASNVNAYQWQVDNGSGFADVSNNTIYSGASSAMLTLTHTPAGYNNYQYRCKLTSTCGAVAYTNVANLVVVPEINITGLPTSLDVCTGSKGTISISHAGIATNYQWQLKTQVTGTYIDLPNAYPFAGANTDKLEVLFAADSLQNAVFRCIVTGDCNTQTSADVPVNLIKSPYFKDDPVDDDVLPYQNAWFEVGVGGSPNLQLYWQSSSDGVNYVNINNSSLYSGAKAVRVVINNTPPTFDGMRFRCILKSTNPVCGEYRDTSGSAKINILFPNNVPGTALGAEGFSIYPNPVAGNALFVNTGVAYRGEEAHISVIDVAGRVVYSTNLVLSGHDKMAFPAGIPAGQYAISLKTGKYVHVIKITRE